MTADDVTGRRFLTTFMAHCHDAIDIGLFVFNTQALSRFSHYIGYFDIDYVSVALSCEDYISRQNFDSSLDNWISCQSCLQLVKDGKVIGNWQPVKAILSYT